MTISLATDFPFNDADSVTVAVSPDDIDPSSVAEDIVDVDLRRKLITDVKPSAQIYTVTLTLAAGQDVNFVSIIGPSLGGDATVKLLPASGNTEINTGQTTLALVKDKASSKLFTQTYTGVRRVQVAFPSVPGDNRLECGLILTGLLKTPQVEPQAVRTQLGEWRPERAPRDVQMPSAGRGTYRIINVVWTSMGKDARNEVFEAVRDVDARSTIFFNDQNSSDDPVFGFIDGMLDITDRRFSTYSDARLRINEVVPLIN